LSQPTQPVYSITSPGWCLLYSIVVSCTPENNQQISHGFPDVYSAPVFGCGPRMTTSRGEEKPAAVKTQRVSKGVGTA